MGLVVGIGAFGIYLSPRLEDSGLMTQVMLIELSATISMTVLIASLLGSSSTTGASVTTVKSDSNVMDSICLLSNELQPATRACKTRQEMPTKVRILEVDIDEINKPSFTGITQLKAFIWKGSQRVVMLRSISARKHYL